LNFNNELSFIKQNEKVLFGKIFNFDTKTDLNEFRVEEHITQNEDVDIEKFIDLYFDLEI